MNKLIMSDQISFSDKVLSLVDDASPDDIIYLDFSKQCDRHLIKTYGKER